MAYQSFPWQTGDSESAQKLRALQLPDLSGLRVLDIGCNAGFFCGYAAWQGASEVVGVDMNGDFIAMAREIFPGCRFVCQDWATLDDSKYDVILFLSAIHYAPDQRAMLDFLMERVSPRGMLVLEIGVAPGSENKFVEVSRSIDKRFFPTSAKLESMLSRYAIKVIGKSVPQGGDPIPRMVYHVSHRRPVAVTLLDAPHTGKSSIARAIFREDMRVISGDTLYYEILHGKRDAPPEIRVALSMVKEGDTLNCASATYHICKNGWVSLLGDLIAEAAQGSGFVLDMYVSPPWREALRSCLDEKGFFVADLRLFEAESRLRGRETSRELSGKYMDYLAHDFLINEKDYLAANPDVAAAIERGRCPDAQTHYWFYGRAEDRKLKPDSGDGKEH